MKPLLRHFSMRRATSQSCVRWTSATIGLHRGEQDHAPHGTKQHSYLCKCPLNDCVLKDLCARWRARCSSAVSDTFLDSCAHRSGNGAEQLSKYTFCTDGVDWAASSPASQTPDGDDFKYNCHCLIWWLESLVTGLRVVNVSKGSCNIATIRALLSI